MIDKRYQGQSLGKQKIDAVIALIRTFPLHNRALHISGIFKSEEKANIEDQKANIEASFTVKQHPMPADCWRRLNFIQSLEDRTCK